MLFGYARVSTQDQKLDHQLSALNDAGCEMIFSEKVSGKNTNRPELKKMLAQLRPGDTIIVLNISRFGRSLIDLVNLMEKLKHLKVNFRSLTDGIDISTSAGVFTYNLFSVLAEFHRSLIREETLEGLNTAREQGRTGGRPKGLSESDKEVAKAVRVLYDSKLYTIKRIANTVKKSRPTVYRYLRHTEKLEPEQVETA